jgi:hypothetical protein
MKRVIAIVGCLLLDAMEHLASVHLENGACSG